MSSKSWILYVIQHSNDMFIRTYSAVDLYFLLTVLVSGYRVSQINKLRS